MVKYLLIVLFEELPLCRIPVFIAVGILGYKSKDAIVLPVPLYFPLFCARLIVNAQANTVVLLVVVIIPDCTGYTDTGPFI